MKPHVVVPTRDRASWERQHTLRQLLAAGLRVSLVVPRGQVGPYKALLSVNEETSMITVVRCPTDGIGRVRRWIVNSLYPGGMIVMLDDDLRLFHAGTVAGPQATRQMIVDLCRATGELSPLAGIGKDDEPRKVYAVSPWLLRHWRLRFGRIRMYEDIDMALQVRKSGLMMRMLPLYSYRHLGGNARDGVAGYKAVIKRNAWRKLKRLHPEIE